MRRSGFTMIELIFVIVVIGILAAVALPKFTGITDKAKINAELSTMNNLRSALEWPVQSYKDIATPSWNGGKDGNRRTYDFDDDGFEEHFDLIDADVNRVWLHALSNIDSKAETKDVASSRDFYKEINEQGTLFSQISKDGGKGMRVQGALVATINHVATGWTGDDVLIITGKASDPDSGVDFPSEEVAGEDRDLVGKPDKNDFWIFNPLEIPIVLKKDRLSDDTRHEGIKEDIVIPSLSIKLIDIRGTIISPVKTESSNYSIEINATKGTYGGSYILGDNHDVFPASYQF